MLQKTLPKSSKENADALIIWIRQYAASRIDSRLADERNCFPPHVFLDLGNQGFFGMHIPHSQGGLELNTYDILRVIEQVAAIDLTLVTLIIEGIQGAHTLWKYASKNLKNKYLPQLASGRILVAGAMTESAAGSNPRAMQAAAIPNGENSWLINGHKRWVGMGYWATVTAVYVQQFDDQHNWLGMSGFLVPQDSPGLEIGPETQTMGIRAIGKHILHLNNVEVTSEQLLGHVGQGMEIAQDNMMYVRLCLAAANVGAMKRSAQLMYRYAKRRTIATGQMLENPLTLLVLSELTAVIHAIENFVYLIGSLLDETPQAVPEEALVCVKILGSEYLGWTVDKLVQMLGARGYEESSGVSQLFRDARTFRIFEGPTEALAMYAGSRMQISNSRIQNFFCDTLQQAKLFDEIIILIDKVKAHCKSHKQDLFAKPFSVDYLSQAIIGDIISYGMLLAITEYSAQITSSKENIRVAAWARSKFDEITQKHLSFSAADKVFIPAKEIKELTAHYFEKIGDIEQTRISQQTSSDTLLKRAHKYSAAHENDILHFLNNELLSNIKTSNTANHITSSKETQTGSAYPDTCAHNLFEEQAANTPEGIALTYNDKTLSYKELNIQANQLAHFLKRKGISENVPVAIFMERSFHMIISVLAVLKSGGVCVPLDRHYPAERTQFMLDDSDAQIVLMDKNLSAKLDITNKEAIFIDEIQELLSLESDKNLPTISNTNNLIYIIYTSGSTGKPKGVMLPHKALKNLISYQNEKIKEKRNVLQFTTLSFDMSFFEIFSAFSFGGTLVLISEQDRLDLLNFARIIKKYAIEQLALPVPFFRKLIEEKIDINHFSTLKEIITTGEQLILNDSAVSFFKQLTHCKLLNYYGPAETHVVTTYELPSNPSDWPAHPPIGHAIKNVDILILDENLKPVPLGTVGEIFIGGACVAKGYKSSTSLTQEKFLSAPSEKGTDNRLYRTGDFAKYLPDGDILFVGRKDDQVKISGFRIELQEIEEKLLQHKGIKDVAVIVKYNDHQEKYLEAFFVTKTAMDETYIEQIRSFLNKTLPHHMIPTVFNQLEEMPLTPTGKINKIALSQMNSLPRFYADKLIEPNTDTEKKVVEIFEKFFNARLGINHSFISIGGNSLLAMTIASKLNATFQVEVPACTILSEPTIEDISYQIDSLKKISFKEKETVI